MKFLEMVCRMPIRWVPSSEHVISVKLWNDRMGVWSWTLRTDASVDLLGIL